MSRDLGDIIKGKIKKEGNLSPDSCDNRDFERILSEGNLLFARKLQMERSAFSRKDPSVR
jgi:hypothetical protein